MQTEELFQRAHEQHIAGHLAQARDLYLQIVALDPAHGAAQFRLAVIGIQENRFQDAIERLTKALEVEPGNRRYREALGQALAFAQRHAEAASIYRGLIDEDAADADHWFGLASALQAQGAVSDAALAWEGVAQRDPQRADALNNLGNCRRLLGEPALAQAAYARALAAQPGNADALTNLGTLLQAQGQHAQALPLLREAVAVAPDSAAALVNLGALLMDDAHAQEAADVLARAVALAPDFAPAAYNYGNALHALGQRREAQAQYRRALAIDPAHAEAANNLGNVCRELGEHKAAMEAFDTALKARPDFVDACNNAANLHRALGHQDAARALLSQALALAPHHSPTLNNLGNVFKDCGELDDGVACFRQAVASDPRNLTAHSNLLYALSFQSFDGEEIAAEARRLAAQHEAPLRAERIAHAPRSAQGRRLRIAYVSSDFREHCQALFMTPLLSHHDRSRFEIHAYSSVVRADATTAQLAAHVDHWHDVRLLDDAALAARIQADGIDILVDLAMHMADGRPLLFARQPAPVQVAWLAYPGTTGLDAIGYRLSDPHLDPHLDPQAEPAMHDRHYTERTLRLPDTFWCYDPLAQEPAVNALPAAQTGQVTLGSLNNPCKLTEATLALWSGVFAALPQARLLLMAAQGEARERLLTRLARHGIDAARVRFVPFQPRDAYLRTWHEIDLALDTLPYNGHTTSLDAMWMGVPVVTRVGTTCAGRAGLSQLANLGLDELAAFSDEAFVETVAALVNDLPRLAALRASLRARMEASPLMDGARFARGMESAYETMWREWTRARG
ncbi:tetratricopeptide repeat protein [Paraburkholderia tropica]|uniref:protein O-GlcNAc transferase n=1 Tax=Paraburkholderia tropica TaxID=92647 RepID=A0ABX5MID4_9BURK|nr:tetratricopeptide repeat protein [Paraburkholderia tropica]MDE1138371.1 tetratricopeptide repeat protein [Paraburkholderia tropica]PXX11759.1 putative O-linked N-acetylglucosamine transferase (SPINDLY family) [Paraburkholderia tropica]PZW77168.1 putative O-linked N-acetylglucosamine transferase (SPINDLY family) [Paraburkholderia tropica]